MASVAMRSPVAPVGSYSNIALAATGKEGVLKKLDKGYSEIIIGAFAAFGNGGWLYDERSAMRYLENDQDFLRMLQAGRIRSEWGHPRRPPGMSDQDWFVRICEIYEPNWAAHIRRVRPSLEVVVDEKGRKVVAIIGEVCGSGVNAKAFNDMMDNPDEDVNFSIRCFAKKDFATFRKHINKIITWDVVFDPGIAVATKYKTPSLESRSYVSSILDQAEFNLEAIRHGMDQAANDCSLESDNPAFKILDSLYEESKSSIFVPKSFGW